MSSLIVLCLLLAILFVVLLLRSWSRLRGRRWISAGLYAVPTSVTFLVLFLLLLILSNLATYKRLTQEREIAEMSIQQLAEQHYEVILKYRDNDSDGPTASYRVIGDEWRVEARILKWHGWANLLGLDSYYQLDRLSGRFRNVAQASTQLPSIHALSTESRGLDLWRLKQITKSKLPFFDAYYGQAVFLPLQHEAAFRLSINQTGLIARPVNEVARQALDNW